MGIDVVSGDVVHKTLLSSSENHWLVLLLVVITLFLFYSIYKLGCS